MSFLKITDPAKRDFIRRRVSQDEEEYSTELSIGEIRRYRVAARINEDL